MAVLYTSLTFERMYFSGKHSWRKKGHVLQNEFCLAAREIRHHIGGQRIVVGLDQVVQPLFSGGQEAGEELREMGNHGCPFQSLCRAAILPHLPYRRAADLGTDESFRPEHPLCHFKEQDGLVTPLTNSNENVSSILYCCQGTPKVIKKG